MSEPLDELFSTPATKPEDLAREVVPDDEGPKYKYEVQNLYANKATSVRVITVVMEGAEYYEVYKMLQAVKAHKNETNAEAIIRLIKKAYQV